MNKILITGGSGLVGKALTNRLLELNYEVKHLGRTKKGNKNVEEYVWNISDDYIEEGAIEKDDIIIHLAGENVGKGKWTQERKQRMINSRVSSTQLLFKKIKDQQIPIQKFIGASAIGYYGMHDREEPYQESDLPGDDFMASICKEWEKKALQFESLNIPVIILRIGVTLSAEGGALASIAKPVRSFLGAPIGSGKQNISWIHIEDLCRIFIEMINGGTTGIFNAVSPNPVTNKQLIQTIGRCLKKPIWPFHVPAAFMKMLLGEQAEIVLKGSKVSSQKIQAHGFQFNFKTIEEAIEHLL